MLTFLFVASKVDPLEPLPTASRGSPGSRGEELKMATHGKPMSRLQRSIDAPHRRLLSKLEEKWSLEEDRAMIKNKCCSHPEL